MGTPLARNTDPATSHLAIDSTPLGKYRGRVYDAVCRLGTATAVEAAYDCVELHGGMYDSYRRRASECYLLGYLEQVQPRRCKISGKLAACYKPVGVETMQTPSDATRQELNQLLGTLTAVKQIDGNRGKGEFLIEAFKKNPASVKYLLWMATEPPPDEAPLLLAREIPNLPPALAHLARGLCNRTLEIGCPAAVVLKAIERSGVRPVKEPRPAAELDDVVIRLQQIVGDSCAAVLLVGGVAAANMSFRVGPGMTRAIAKLRQMGVLFEGKNNGT